ncbi:drug resistance MFS transporter, drug:H+ antiporter-2 (14 Spanner) (DHA2) family [Serratia fonticola]|uniref:Drug resistance MFS transporter, drug:H+ antiporter-2 (14 Spanner) (DHA2) family n=1 Tax=Serratia fonticola TaxID=47917 RepID=A0A4U9W6E2_SERFO|nr:drug resistance MFS transporter, drug:H+ antiporter-2 (14 Spanner) (DHA2) family [Serratia fonticola]
MIVGILISALTCLIAFVVIELRSKEPMLELSLLRHPRFIGVQILPLGTCYCYIVLIVLLPFRLTGVEGISPIQSGLVMLALSAPMLVVPLLAAWLTRWITAGTLSGVGFLLAATGLYMLSQVPIGDHRQLILAMLIIGIGTGFPWGLMDGLAVSVVPKEQAGMRLEFLTPLVSLEKVSHLQSPLPCSLLWSTATSFACNRRVIMANWSNVWSWGI